MSTKDYNIFLVTSFFKLLIKTDLNNKVEVWKSEPQPFVLNSVTDSLCNLRRLINLGCLHLYYRDNKNIG